MVCSFPVELRSSLVPDAHGPQDRSWGLYAGLAEVAGARGAVDTGHPDITAGTLTGPVGRMVALTNHAATGLEVENGRVGLRIDPYGAVVLTCSVRD